MNIEKNESPKVTPENGNGSSKDYTLYSRKLLSWLFTILGGLALLGVLTTYNAFNEMKSVDILDVSFATFSGIIMVVFGVLFFLKKNISYQNLRILLIVFLGVDLLTELLCQEWIEALANISMWGGFYLLALDTVSQKKFKISISLMVLTVVILGVVSFLTPIDQNAQVFNPNNSFSESTQIKNCPVSGIALRGTLLTYIPNHSEYDAEFDRDVSSSENVNWLIKEANANEKVKALLVEVDSGGGSPVAGEEVANAISNSEKPVVAIIREVGASASYMAISSADKIFSSKNSTVGGIGVTASYLSNVEKNQKEGYTYEQLIVGKYKDYGSPDKPLTREEKDLFLRDIKIIYDNFLNLVSKNRNIPLEKITAFADGSTVMGEKAKELGLIDEIGGMLEAEKYLEELIGTKPEICW